MKPYQTYLDVLEVITKRRDDEVTALAAKVREKIIVPACRKHRLRFVSGMGTFFFVKTITVAAHQEELRVDGVQDPDFTKLSKATQATLRPIFDLLDQEISHAQHLGFWVEDVE